MICPSRATARPLAIATALAAALATAAAQAADPVTLVLKDHHFIPDHVTVPAGQRFRIELTNQDQATAEFESAEMKFEKIAVAGATIKVFAGPLHPGAYSFVDDYNPDQARGTITAGAEK